MADGGDQSKRKQYELYVMYERDVDHWSAYFFYPTGILRMRCVRPQTVSEVRSLGATDVI